MIEFRVKMPDWKSLWFYFKAVLSIWFTHKASLHSFLLITGGKCKADRADNWPCGRHNNSRMTAYSWLSVVSVGQQYDSYFIYVVNMTSFASECYLIASLLSVMNHLLSLKSKALSTSHY